MARQSWPQRRRKCRPTASTAEGTLRLYRDTSHLYPPVTRNRRAFGVHRVVPNPATLDVLIKGLPKGEARQPRPSR
jgi:hypothetical protein